MHRVVSKPASILTILIAVLAIAASAGGLLIDGLYRDNAFVASTWRGTDLVTLVVGVPLLVSALILARGGSAPAYLVWLGLVDAMLYNYGFYLFGAAFNAFFMLYAAIVALSIWTLIFGLIRLDAPGLRDRFGPRTPVRLIAGFMLFVALGLGAIYVAQWLGFIASGQLPGIVVASGHPTSVVFALDLTLVIPFLIVGGIWLWRRRPWGYVIGAIINVKGAVYMLGLCAATLTAYRAGTVEDLSEIGLWGAIGVGCLLAALALLANLRDAA